MHGYDLHDAVFLNSTRFVSIAEEKVARVFEAPRSFVLLAKQLGYLPDVVDENDVSLDIIISSALNALLTVPIATNCCLSTTSWFVKQGTK